MEQTQNPDIPTAPARLLVVEDEQSLRTILKIQLERAGYIVSTASDGDEGLRRAVEERPDLIVLDWMMPRMDGNEVCRALKSNFATNHIPVIMLTAKSELSDRLQGLSDGANDYVVKPYQAEELLLRVHNLLLWSRSQRQANPLTGLPGNSAIEEEFQRRLNQRTVFAFLYLDIDNFKGFNDYYGYRQGDKAIKLLAGLLIKATARYGAADDFVGHIGGDDFVVIAAIETAQTIAESVVEEFDHRVSSLYHAEDLDRGYIKVVDRKGQRRKFPIMTLTVAAVTNQGRRIHHVGEITDIAAELKHYGKGQEGSIVVWERRSSA
ncbi:MAG: response regulator [Candidatus Eisenbacteria bacterium]|nr:response regulator [Candidatus Eisenbacteria bacterium]